MRIFGKPWLWLSCVAAISAQAVYAQAPSTARSVPLMVGHVPVADILQRLGAKLERGSEAKELDAYSSHFDRMDTNRDGKHTRAEYVDKGDYMTPQARAGIFRAADGNADGVVIKAEYVLNRIITDEAKAIVQGMDDDKDGLAERAEFVKHAAKLLSDRELAEQVFAALDTNADGGIPIPEYLRVWGQWARTGRKSAEQRIAARRAVESKVQPALENCPACAMGLTAEFVFNRLDVNEDKLVTITEFRRSPGMADEAKAAEAVGRIDKGGNGTLTWEEFGTAYKARHANCRKPDPAAIAANAARVRPDGRGDGSRFARVFIMRSDKDGDGRISKPEFRGSETGFERMDKNRSGFIETDELGELHQRRLADPKSMSQRLQEGDVRRPPFGRPGAGAGPPGVDEIFERFDRNEDGKLQKDEVPEFLAQRFILPADANGDDMVTREELQASRQRRRPVGHTASDWPGFHGPNRDNKSTDKGLLKTWPEGGPLRIWEAAGIGEGYSTVAIVGRRIYTAGAIDDDCVITALDMDGKEVWKRANGKAWSGSYPGTRSTPTIANGLLYHLSGIGNLICLKADSGDVVWTVNTVEKFGGRNIKWGLAESPLVIGDMVICTPGGTNVSMVALEKRTGEVLWQCTGAGDRPGYASALLIEHEGLKQIVTPMSESIVGVRASDGKLLWRYPHKVYTDQNITTPLFHDGSVIVSGCVRKGTTSLRLRVSGDQCSVETHWHNETLDNKQGGIILLGGRLYGYAPSQNRSTPWVCVDFKSGDTIFQSAAVTSSYKYKNGCLTCADGMLYLYSDDGKVALTRPTPTGLEVTGRLRINDPGERPTWAHPVVHGGRLYLRYGDKLGVYNVSRGADQ